MTLIVISGCEKSGKTTLAEVLRKQHGADVIHWGPVRSSYIFLNRLREDVLRRDLVVWDRSWVCEGVYANYYQHKYSAFKNDWWLGEWALGRAATTAGTSVVLLGPSVEALEAKRDDTDLDIPVATERRLYQQYANRFGLLAGEHSHTEESAYLLANYLVQRASDPDWPHYLNYTPPSYCGPRWAPVVFVGDVRNGQSEQEGVWLPFSTRLTSRYGRILGDDAMKCGWTNTDGPLYAVERAKLVVACGATAQRFVVRCTGATNVLKVPHPAWLYRWAGAEPERGPVETAIRDSVREILGSSTYQVA